jgi:two-component system, sensor histidine kinase YesM
VVMIKEETSLRNQLTIYSIFIIVAGFIILLAVFSAFFILVRSLTKPLNQLTATIETVSLDNMNLEIPHEGQDELKILNESFNAMFAKLKDSINLVYESRIREINANLLALQAQMNPHFLYNTLGVISASSEKFGNFETASMCNKLSEMMRYIVSPVDSVVTLKEETVHTLNYLNLMESHYQDYRNNSGSFLKYKISIPEEMNSIYIPKMILQPIVENCINHGFDNALPPWHITINGYYTTDNDWHLSVEDDGAGFDKTILNQINTDISEYRMNIKDGNLKQNLNIGGMGIINTFARLAINFKDDAFFNIENSQDKGCVVSFGRRNLLGERG